jgi:hypothetical protein
VIPRAFLLRRIVDRSNARKSAHPFIAKHLRDRRRQRRLAVVNVPDRPHVHVGLRPLKDFLRHAKLYANFGL